MRASFDDGEGGTCRASRRIAPAPASTTAIPAGSPASASCTPSTRAGSASTRSPTPGYTLLNADLGYTFKLDGQAGLAPEMTIGLKGENLLDDDVRNHVSFKKDEVLSRPQPSGSMGSSQRPTRPSSEGDRIVVRPQGLG